QVYLDEMRAANVPDLDNARATEDQKKLTAEEHMEILRNNNFKPSAGGKTRQTYQWFNGVKSGRRTVPQVYLDEMRAANVPDLDNVRATEDQKKLTAEEHMEILRNNNFKPRTGGKTRQTYQWFNGVKSGKITVPQVYLDEMRAANVPDLDNARATEDQKKRTAEEHMETLRNNNFKPSSVGETAQTYDWLQKIRNGHILVSQDHLDAMREVGVSGLDNARTR
ncbi:hypothetical protein, partial [Streptomyces violaceorubidus]|uniref:hypothetical protein n=1 Tax=Streptomyces violaceorubidus TaxID=284042 RepID=UPI000564A526